MKSSETLGQYLTRKRKSIGMTQEALAEELAHRGMSRASSTVANWETDRDIPRTEVLVALAQILREPSPAKLFDLAGLLDSLPGREIVLLLDGLDTAEIERAARVVRAMLDSK